MYRTFFYPAVELEKKLEQLVIRVIISQMGVLRIQLQTVVCRQLVFGKNTTASFTLPKGIINLNAERFKAMHGVVPNALGAAGHPP